MPRFSPPSRVASLRKQHPRAIKSLESILARRRVPNALLFTGSSGSGRQSAAHLFARALNCTGTEKEIPAPTDDGTGSSETTTSPLYACGSCRSCRKTDAGMHPDILVVKPEKNTIAIARIRSIYAAVSSLPHEGRYRMVLVEDAQLMTVAAANALLKILEEPPEKTFFILTADTPTALLPTITSRCRQIPFGSTAPGELAAALGTASDLPAKQVAIAVAASQGSPTTARRFLNLDPMDTVDWQKRRIWLFKAISHLIQCGCAHTPAAPYALFLAERLARETDTRFESLLLIYTWLRDLMVIPHDPMQIINTDHREVLTRLALSVPRENTVAWIKALHRAETRINANAALRPALESFFLQLSSPSMKRT